MNDWLQDAGQARDAIATHGFVRLAPPALRALAGVRQEALDALRPSWDRLPPDAWLRDGGHYRRRRHACFVLDCAAGRLEQAPHRPHWQPVDYNALHGGIERLFEPVDPQVCSAPAWRALIVALGRLFEAVSPAGRWYVEAHQFRIDTTDGLGRPTPEGAHRDGVDFVAVILVDRCDVRGGESRVFEARGPRGLRFTMTEPWSAVLMDDAAVVHETSPIQPGGPDPHRDTLVLTFRRDGFLAPAAFRSTVP